MGIQSDGWLNRLESEKECIGSVLSLSFTLVSLSTLYKVTRKEEEDKRSWKTIREVKDE